MDLRGNHEACAHKRAVVRTNERTTPLSGSSSPSETKTEPTSNNPGRTISTSDTSEAEALDALFSKSNHFDYHLLGPAVERGSQHSARALEHSRERLSAARFASTSCVELLNRSYPGNENRTARRAPPSASRRRLSAAVPAGLRPRWCASPAASTRAARGTPLRCRTQSSRRRRAPKSRSWP
jgi:hypothetical protein